MKHSAREPHSSRRPRQGESGIRLGSLFGITVILDWSLLIVATLIATSVALGPLAQWHPDWSAPLRWLMGIGAAVLLFASVLIHEFSHALMARRYGTLVERITLFIFGGMAHMEDEPKHWRAELLIAIVGPITSIVLGVLFFLAAGFSLDSSGLENLTPEEMLSSMGALPTLLFWAGNVNIILAIFNLVPAFPLDGGRVLRAIFWGATGNYVRSTEWAASGGRLFGWLLMTAGIAMILGISVPFFGSGLAGGIWLVFIGWFLARVAMVSYQEASVKESLARVTVGEIMRSDFAALSPESTVEDLVENYLLPKGQRGFPVLDQQRLVGMVSFEDVRQVPRGKWANTRVADIMTRQDRLLTLEAGDDSFKALARLSSAGVNQMPVLRGEQVVGLLQREDVLRWLQLYRPDQVGQGLAQQ
ncbi:M50 family metallopeptidase [Gilvimarinus sp. F26214L]|uniref:M50 family metallopeptidase n=1 Tax=Gilvimarinus sp. DZF01 TaxID=3461371 RepID=UPI004045A817